MGICKVLIKMKGKLKTKQIITNKHTRVSVFFSCVVFSDVIFFNEPEKEKSLCILLLQMVSVQNEGLCLHLLK